MKQTMLRFHRTALLLAAAAGFASPAGAYQADAQFSEELNRHAEEWRRQDAQVGQRLEALVKRFGKRPNIIYILADDIGWGELGAYGGGKVRGTPTPTLDAMAQQGMKLLSHYAEPLCTPTRVALATGRIPIRTGVTQLLYPGHTQGLVKEEYALAQLLSDAGYDTAMFGKWHMGELDEHQPTNHGFDYAYYTLYNGTAWSWADDAEFFDASHAAIGGVPYFMDVPPDYEARFNLRVHGVLEARKGKPPRQLTQLSLAAYNEHDDDLTNRVLEFVKQHAGGSRPFFAYFASNANQAFACPPAYRHLKYVDSGNCQAAQLAQHDANVQRILTALRDLQIEQNTLVVWMSDNGPMYDYFPSAGYSWLRGGKGDAYEGGIRTPAIAWWPGTIQPGQDPLDMVHVTDWYVTAARLAGAMQRLPTDRVIDGIDQSALLLLGEGHSHRNYLYVYENYGGISTNAGLRLMAIRHDELKYFVNAPEIYNIIRDPGEKHSAYASYLWAKAPFQEMLIRHQKLMEKFPNRVIPESSQPGTLTLQ